MADFRHTLDWFAMYPRDALYAAVAARTPLDLKQVWPSFCFSTIRGVQIQGGREFKETERYKAVDVPADSSIRGLFSQLQGEISPISKRLGRPLRLTSEPSEVHAPSWEHELPSCGPVTALLRSLTKDLDAPSPGMLFSLPRGGLLRDNRALVVRADDKDLSIDELRAMAYFAEYMCNVKIYGVVRLPREDEPALEAAMKEALDFMTWDNCLLAFDKLRIPRHQQPAKQAFVDTRDAARPEDL
ncbi:hypothetical protein N8I77_011652 [Diaporthe amygdali]|uniref:Uncharacterized protein n=1 Tax=Phomopsis amygdali TaxID=1214568 RepID=A0AAD9VXG9_PHOAM|nr:hypothetical protein N8I77_011652 [Diaporthe amygdali]